MKVKSQKLLKIGIVGCGAIGNSLAKAILKELSGKAKLVSLYDINKEKSVELSLLSCGSAILAAADLKTLIKKSQLVIEASHADYSWQIARQSIAMKRDIMVMSVGGLLGHLGQLYALAARFNARVYLPTGAICGIDALKAAACGRINKVILTTKKPPQAFSNVPYVKNKKMNFASLKKELLVYEGSALSAVRAFPQNINVAAILSIAGIGPKKTIVRIIAVPGLARNTHEVEIYSDSGRIFSRTENSIHPYNPKTSFLAVLSALAVLKQILSPVRVGT